MKKKLTIAILCIVFLFVFKAYLHSNLYTKYDDRIKSAQTVSNDSDTSQTDDTAYVPESEPDDTPSEETDLPAITIEPNSTELVPCTLVRVVDGDTIVVNINNDEFKVRMIGVDTPESVASETYLEQSGKENMQEGKDASEYTKSRLTEGMTLYLQTDTSNTDKYGRLLRYVWLTDDVNVSDENDIINYMYNASLLINGYAEPMTIKPDTTYADMFEYLYTIANTQTSAKTADQDFTIHRTGIMYYIERMLNNNGYDFSWEKAFTYAITE